jgi:hypothetical protein
MLITSHPDRISPHLAASRHISPHLAASHRPPSVHFPSTFQAVIRMVDYAYDNFWTTTYAKFQLLTNGIVA